MDFAGQLFSTPVLADWLSEYPQVSEIDRLQALEFQLVDLKQLAEAFPFADLTDHFGEQSPYLGDALVVRDL